MKIIPQKIALLVLLFIASFAHAGSFTSGNIVHITGGTASGLSQILVNANTDFADTYGPHLMYLQSADAKNALAIGNNAGTSRFAFYVNNGSHNEFQLGTITNSPFGFFTNNATPTLSLSTNGGVSIGAYGNNNAPANGLIVSGSTGIGTNSPTATLTLNGSLARNIFINATATYTVSATDTNIIANFAGISTLTLPAAASFPGREIVVRTIQAQTVVSATANVIPMAGGAAGTAILAATAGKWAMLISDGTNWQIMEGN